MRLRDGKICAGSVETSADCSPQINRLGGAGFEWQQDFASGARRFVGGEDYFHYYPRIVAGDDGLFIVLYAIYKVSHLLDEAVIPNLFVNCEGPPHREACFFHSVVVTGRAVGFDG